MKKFINILVLAFTIISFASCDNEEVIDKFYKYSINIPNGECFVIPAEGCVIELYSKTKLKNGELDDVCLDRILDLGTQTTPTNYYDDKIGYIAISDPINWKFDKEQKKGSLEIKPNNTDKSRAYHITFKGKGLSTLTSFTLTQSPME